MVNLLQLMVHLCCQLPNCKFTGFQIYFSHSTSALREGSSATNQSSGQILGQRLCVFRREKSGGSSLIEGFNYFSLLVAFDVTCKVISLLDYGHLVAVSAQKRSVLHNHSLLLSRLLNE